VEHQLYYQDQFQPSELITSIEKTNNLALQNIIHKNKLRTPSSIEDRRLLLLIGQCIGRPIYILDIEGIILDTIGIDKPGILPIVVYTNYVSRFNVYYYNDQLISIVHKSYV
jgi:hypothetical protein